MSVPDAKDAMYATKHNVERRCKEVKNRTGSRHMWEEVSPHMWEEVSPVAISLPSVLCSSGMILTTGMVSSSC